MLNNSSVDSFKNKHVGGKILIVGCGNSAAKLIPYKNKVHNYFDAVIGANKAFVEFDSIMDYHLVAEKVTERIKDLFATILNVGDFNVNTPRMINFKGIRFFDENKYNLFPITRGKHNGDVDLRSYSKTHVDGSITVGFLSGPPGSDNFSLGTVMMQSIHLACILGALDIYMIGADMVFKNNFDHFYNDRIYRDKIIGKKSNQHKIVKVGELESTRYFVESAKFLDGFIDGNLKQKGINVYDFSDGLITKAKKLDLDTFFS